MKKYIPLFAFAILFSWGNLQAQDLNKYKYVIVPQKYDFVQKKDQYQLNSLTKFLFEKHGFETLMEGESFPDDLKNDPCLALNSDVLSDSGMFSFLTKVKIVLKNCSQQIIFESKEGKSKLKDRRFGYQEALRDAFTSVEALQHSFTASSEIEPIDLKKDVQKNHVKEEPQKPESSAIFLIDGIAHSLEKQINGFAITNQTSKDTVAHLNKTSRGDYIFRSNAGSGTAYFDEKGNLIVEYFDVATSTMKKEKYLIQN